MPFHRTLRTLVAGLLMMAASVALASEPRDVATAWRLLDYIAVDYREAVKDGAIANDAEYREMTEFSASARQRIDALPASPALASLRDKAAGLERAIVGKQAPEEVARLAREVASSLIAAYPVPIAPAQTPDLERGRQVYAQHCASCHGVTGGGDGPATVGADMDPPPIAFSDEERARERSVFALYQVIEQGLDGTSMPSFADTLSPQDRWAVAAYAGTLAYPPDAVAAGERIWKADDAFRATMNLDRLMALRPAELAAQRGETDGKALTAYLRHRLAEAAAPSGGHLTLARQRLNEALDASRAGDRKRATDLALSAYLDGFEPLEPALAARDNALMVRIEEAMIAVRAGIAEGVGPDAVAVDIGRLDTLFGEAEAKLSEGPSSGLAMLLASFAILFREGLEALLIVVSMLACLRKADRPDMARWVHYGWALALVAGAATWALATWIITISGAGRELTEGFGSLLAAIVLVWVGIWMHGKSHAGAWQSYIRDRLTGALSRGSGFFLLGLAFLIVYREVFETILFYAAIWNQGEAGAVLAGAALAVLALALIAWMMIRFGMRLPIGQFFGAVSILLAGLAVVLIGKAVAAFQEAGSLPVLPLSGYPRIEMLGLYPTREGVAAQIILLVILAIGFVYARRSDKHLPAERRS